MGHPLASVAVAVLAVLPQVRSPEPGLRSPLAAQVDREEARRHYQAGETLMLEEAFEAAVREFQTAVTLDPDYTLAHYGLGQALMAQRRHAEALDAFTAARDVIIRQSHQDQRDMADVERRRRDEINELEDTLQNVRSGKMKVEDTFRLELPIEERLRVLRDAEQRGVENVVRIPAELSLALGSAHFRMGQIEAAEENYRAAIKARPGLGAAHNNLAVICMMTDRYEEAKREIRAAEETGFIVSPLFKADLEKGKVPALPQ
jgi:tetratricopeptide (TPR) repeat protein